MPTRAWHGIISLGHPPMERYRSGHNGADSKSVCRKRHMGSNPILSATFGQATYVAWPFSYSGLESPAGSRPREGIWKGGMGRAGQDCRWFQTEICPEENSLNSRFPACPSSPVRCWRRPDTGNVITVCLTMATLRGTFFIPGEQQNHPGLIEAAPPDDMAGAAWA